MKRFLLTASIVAAIAGGAALVIVVSGAIPLRASDGHWAVTAWALDFAKRRSVATHSIGLTPALDEPWLVMKGAAHYEGGCRPCHGAPGKPMPAIPRLMLPHPPAMPQVVPTYDSAELFYIVKHGIKLTGMPGWIAQQRDDEVRAVVAFIAETPRMQASDYDALVFGSEAHSESSCARCHGSDGRGRGNAAFPRLAGQSRRYIESALRAYAKADRHSGIMQPLAAAMSEQEIQSAAAYYSGLDPGAADDSAAWLTARDVEEGQRIAELGLPDQGVPSCRECHGPRLGPRNPAYPELTHQFADYLVLQLRLFKSGQRGGSSYAHLMRRVVKGLREPQMRAVAAYYATLTAR